MSNANRGLLVLLLVLLTCVYGFSAQKDTSEMSKFQAAVDAFDKAWDTLDADKIVALFAEDATFLSENAPLLKGRKAIRESFNGPKPEKLTFKRYKVEVRLEGDFAYEIVNQVVESKMKDQAPATILNRYIHVWKKQKDGSWKVLIDMNNLRPK
jgi:uncharacterized protein (TIGR02246 family)